MCAVEYIHSHKKIHRDIKMENVLVAEENPILIKLIDFGIAKVMEADTTKSFVGTPEYLGNIMNWFRIHFFFIFLAPEIILVTNGKISGYDSKCDIWACGVLLYAL